ncbi:MAG: Gfo/Idh/MocA family oxidoreductase [Helicobacter sp.]|uniref:Gfo/Idh/MocA family protein n=1 Tax=Helicobacter sp. 10-6591 TaxID=2004998 RepID=UPI000DCE7ADB|nr:Gfo/Idh/MocA family oxidoreductase [Helicobacter sp. 10-6591]MCI6217181.1 Gfo/Idh/MocA family oxidoreductase [Helicobacter sp.]MCI7485435.1 Gfo/Idh/MocA family oxidoreductase [Helicobacter sp.]MDD7568271.1 Gfo/Idh/MocA family oxidoreductase [Helicobacter sp.]MDY5740305.1 Gfo/Idh/MocA family oxidoreductase [Helicobacter sp.]RAX54566.1 oxidoreductase [Helicobacter sp. 10-6591]
MENKIIKIGLLGIGKMGQNHLRNLNMLKNVDISFIYDVNTELLVKTATDFGVPMLKNDDALEDALKNSDGVIIVTPTFTHFDYIKKVSAHTKNIFVEKPLTDTLDTTQIIVDAARENNLNIQVGFIERYNPAISALKELLKNSDRIFSIDFTRTNKMSSRITDVDVVMDLMIHDIDLSLLFNGEPQSIQAHGIIINGMIEYARAIIAHKNGAFSTITASRVTEKRIRQISVTCEDMYIDCNLLSKEVLVNKQTLEQHLHNISISSRSESIEIRAQEALLLELLDFANLCRSNSKHKNSSLPNENDGKNAMLVANKIQQLIHASAK